MLSIKVPASSANLGPGFDSLGIALNLYNEFAARRPATDPPLPKGFAPLNGGHLAALAVEALARAVGVPPPVLEFGVRARVPRARGLGSSATLTVAGLLAADRVLDSGLSKEALLELASRLEGHPDNAAPALLGGFVISAAGGGAAAPGSSPPPGVGGGTALGAGNAAMLGGGGPPSPGAGGSPPTDATPAPSAPRYLRLLPPKPLWVVAGVPDFDLKTANSRQALPDAVPFGDAVFNAGRSALLVGALLTGRYEYLRQGTQDRLHQPYRQALVPGLEQILPAAVDAGAYGACLSGSGPAVLAFCPRQTKEVEKAIARTWQQLGIKCRVYRLRICPRGATVTEM
ncbi:MAG: homoserine kinase [Peptococcaceae bacterium]|jgi:homoserine kinase|nr:homoserine kinase [Peptococcaceae bacterium]